MQKYDKKKGGRSEKVHTRIKTGNQSGNQNLRIIFSLRDVAYLGFEECGIQALKYSKCKE